MESEQTGLAFSLPRIRANSFRTNSPVEFLHDFLFPSPKARDFVSFGLDDVLHTAASDSEDFGPALTDALQPSGQEARPSAAYSELVDVLSRATEKSRVSSFEGSLLGQIGSVFQLGVFGISFPMRKATQRRVTYERERLGLLA